MEILKVAAKSNPNSVAGALAGVMREKGSAEMQAVGAGAINQAIKAIAIARGFVAPGGIDLVCTPAFAEIEIGGEERTAIRFIVEPRHKNRQA
ncbi:MAG: stage V sporulation protein S [Vulcanimicrobiota bacterium]